MSGSFVNGVNRSWNSLTRFNTSPYRFFWEWLDFVNTHTNLSVVEVGTGTTSHGATIPAAWLSWDGSTDPLALSPALDDNSWIVFQADNADPLLSGGGGMQWQAKIQFTDDAVYTDPSSTDYGANGDLDVVVLRSCPTGGWVGTPTWDFGPVSNEIPSNDMLMFDSANGDYYLDIIADDDTLWWKGAVGDWPGDDPLPRVRAGYLGMISRRNSDVSYPFMAACARMIDATQSGTYPGATGAWAFGGTFGYDTNATNNMRGYTYSVANDKSAILGHKAHPWSKDIMPFIHTYHYSNDLILPQIMVRERYADHHDILGEFRAWARVSNTIAQNIVFGTNLDKIQICYDTVAYYGASMPWPTGVTPIW